MGAHTKILPSVDRSLDIPSAAAALHSSSNNGSKVGLTRPNADSKSLDISSAAAALSPYHSGSTAGVRPALDKSLNTPASAAAALVAPLSKPPTKDPTSPLDVSSTAAAAISPLNFKNESKPGNTGIVRSLSEHELLPAYTETEGVNASTALAVVKSHSDGSKPKVDADGANFKEAEKFLEHLRTKSKESVYTQFLDILAEYTQGKCRPREVSRKVTLLFHQNQHGDLVQEMYKWTPWQHRFYLPFASCTRG